MSTSASRTVTPVFLSSAPVGSSHSKISGCLAMARAIATRCCSPPDNSAGKWSIRLDSPTRSSASSGRMGRARFQSPEPHSPAPLTTARGCRLKDEPDMIAPERGQRRIGQTGQFLGEAVLVNVSTSGVATTPTLSTPAFQRQRWRAEVPAFAGACWEHLFRHSAPSGCGPGSALPGRRHIGPVTEAVAERDVLRGDRFQVSGGREATCLRRLEPSVPRQFDDGDARR